MIKIYLTNLGKYNEGELIGQWVDLPTTEEHLQKVLEDIGVSDRPDEEGNIYDEYFITDWESDIPGFRVWEYSNVGKLNEQAAELAELSKDQLRALEAYLQETSDPEGAIEHVKTGNYIIWTDCDDMTDVAQSLIDESGILDGVPETLARYFDYEAYGRDLESEGRFYKTSEGLIIQLL